MREVTGINEWEEQEETDQERWKRLARYDAVRLAEDNIKADAYILIGRVDALLERLPEWTCPDKDTAPWTWNEEA